MRKLIFSFLAISAAMVVSAAKVAAVSVKTQDGKVADSGDVLARCQVKAGDTYDPEACSRDVRALRDTGDFENITVSAEKVGDGIEVIYTIKRKVRFHGPLNVVGNDEFNAGKVKRLAELNDGFLYGEADFAAAAERIRKEYVKDFYSNAKVTPKLEPIAGIEGAVSVTMEIEEGEKREINEYRFEGDTSMFADETVWGFINEQDVVRAAFEQFPWWNPIGWFSDKPATEQDFSEACEKIRELYRNKGYLDVEVEMPREEVLADGKIDRVFKIEAGPRYIVGALSVTGVKNYPADLVMASVKNIVSGDVASDAQLKEAARSIEVFCGSGTKALSETHVSVRRIPVEGQDGVVDIVFAVKEGYPVVINNVVIRGNDHTKDKVLRREINLSPGDPMLSDKAEMSKRRLENLRYFERVRYYLEPVTGVKVEEGQPVPRDLVYEVAEKNTGNFMVGVGASSVDSVFGTIELSESNFDLFNPWRFRGGGQKGRISLMAGPRYQSYEASVIEPYFLDRPLELSVTMYRRQRWYDDYDIIRNGINVQIAYPVKFWPTWQALGRMGIGLGLEFIEFDDVENSSWYITGNEDKPVEAFKMEQDMYDDSWEVPLEIFWSNDTRDSFMFATRGYKTKLYGDIVGGDNQYWRVGFDYRHYFPVWKRAGHVFMVGIHGATEDTFSDEMPIYNRFFLGGPRNIRGVEYREIAPWIYSQQGKKGKHAPWGGQTLWYMNLEYTIPIVKFLRFAAFSDLGSVGEDGWDFDTEYFCWSAGVGLRIDLPQFPIRLDVATPIDKKSGTDREVFSFTIGYDF
jgi:outer membrane protein insertion porin family